MKSRCAPLLCRSFAFLCVISLAIAGTGADEPKEVDAVRAHVQSYVHAFNSHDITRLLAHWSPDGVYTNRGSGDRATGRAELEAGFKSMFAEQPPPKLAVRTKSLQLVSPNVALERGTAVVTRGDQGSIETQYSVVYVRSSGKWLIDRVTDESSVSGGTHYAHLKKLGWLIGEWIDDGGDVFIEYTCRWTANRNFISRSYTVRSADGETQASGLQIIGWDAANKTIRSWLFDSEGGRVTGEWTQHGDRWLVQSIATLADGSTGSFTSIFDKIDNRSFRWRKVDQVVDGKLLPNLGEVTVRRK